MIKPLPLANAIPGWFTLHDFQIDQQAGTVGYPAGYQATSPCPAGPASPVTARCAGAAHRSTWPHPSGHPTRTSCVPPAAADHSQLPSQLPALAADGERSLSWLVAAGCRRVPYLSGPAAVSWDRTASTASGHARRRLK
jgi:hypothetical protein